MGPDKVDLRYMDQLTWQEFGDRVARDVLILPVGSTEQHAPHLPLGVDVIISRGLAAMVAERVGGMVAPAVAYGYKSQPGSGGGPLFSGTTSLDGATLIALVRDVLVEFLGDGARKILVFNGHFENDMFLSEAADLAMKASPQAVEAGAKIVLTSWWDHVSQPVLDRVFSEVPFPGWALEHAAISETSLVMFLAPHLVRMDRLEGEGLDQGPNYSVFPVPQGFVPPTGRLFTARSSSAEKGRLLAEDITASVVSLLKRVFDA